jgi:O-antigen/teichoic acid export membrane protein
LKAIRVLAFIAFPVLWGISSVAPEVVLVLLGAKWTSAIVPLQLLPLVMPLTIMSPLLNTAFQGIGQGGIVLRNVLTAALIMPAAFWAGARWGVLGLSLAWVLGFPLVLVLNLRRMLPLVGLNFRQLLSASAPAALAACGMYAAVQITRQLTAAELGPSILLGVLISAGAATYAILALVTNKGAVDEIAQLLQLRESARHGV